MLDKFQLLKLLIKLFPQFEKFGGENGIRTHERENPLHAFQACALNRSATSPFKIYNAYIFQDFQSNNLGKTRLYRLFYKCGLSRIDQFYS